MIEKKIVDRCYELKKTIKRGGEGWISDQTYNTDKTYNVVDDIIFKEATDYIQKGVHSFMSQVGIDERWIRKEPYDAWFNIYEENNFQEFHNHTGCAISTVYFVRCDKTSAKIVFKNPYHDMINIPQSSKIASINMRDKVELSGHTIKFQPVPGMLLVFRSHVEHCVERQRSNTERISLAYNFVKEIR